MPREKFYQPFGFTHPIYSRSRPGIERVWAKANRDIFHSNCKYRYCCQFYRELRDYAWRWNDRVTESWADNMAERCYRIAEKKKEDSIQKMFVDYRDNNYYRNPNTPGSPSVEFNSLFCTHAANVFDFDRNHIYWKDGPKGFIMPVNKEIEF